MHADFEGRRALVEQLEFVRVKNYCGCGCATVGLSVDPAAPSAGKDSDSGMIPNAARVVDGNDEIIGGVIVFTDDGYLSLLEVHWNDEPISPFPPLSCLVFGEQT
jgi:hypothetical protein